MRVQLCGKYWTISETRSKRQEDGLCSSPHLKRKYIWVKKGLRDPYRLEVLLHEMLHAVAWDNGEDSIERVARHTAEILALFGITSEAEVRHEPVVEDIIENCLRIAHFHRDIHSTARRVAEDISMALWRCGYGKKS